MTPEDIVASVQLIDNRPGEADKVRSELIELIRAAIAERDRQAVEWVRTHHGDDWMPRALEAYLAQNGGGK